MEGFSSVWLPPNWAAPSSSVTCSATMLHGSVPVETIHSVRDGFFWTLVAAALLCSLGVSLRSSFGSPQSVRATKEPRFLFADDPDHVAEESEHSGSAGSEHPAVVPRNNG